MQENTKHNAVKKTYFNFTFRKSKVIELFFIIWAIVFPMATISDTSLLVRASDFSDIAYLAKHLIFAPFILLVFMRRVSNEVIAYILIFSLYLIYSLYYGEFNSENIIGRLMYPLFLLFGLLYLKIENKQAILKVVFTTSVSTILVLTLLNFINDIPMTHLTNRHRVSLGFGLAHFPATIATLVIMLDYIRISKKIKVAFSIISIAFIILSFTRTAFVILAIFYLHRVSKDNKLLKKALILLAYFFLFIIGLLFFEFYNELNEISSGRFYLWKEVISNNFNIEKLLIGSGNDLLHVWDHRNRPEVNVVHFDNSFIDIILKMGIIGLILSFYNFYIFNQYKKMNFILLILLIYGMLGSVLYSTGNFMFPVLLLLLLSSKCESEIKECGVGYAYYYHRS